MAVAISEQTEIVPQNIMAEKLAGDFGKKIFKEYNARLKKEFKNINSLNVLTYYSNQVRGSNPFAVILVNSIIRPLGLKTASQADLEMAMQTGLDLRGTYLDTALVLRSGASPYDYSSGRNASIVKNLLKQIKARGTIEFPIMIPLNGLDLFKDGKSDYGLTVKLRDDAKLICAPILNSSGGNFASEDIDLETGLPNKLGGGNRMLYTRPDGLSGLCLGKNLDLGSNERNLGYSNEYGRVILIKSK